MPRTVKHWALVWMWVAPFCAPRSVQAWTRAEVRAVRAELSILPEGNVDVTLQVRVRVEGGWLQAFQLDGLEPDLVPDPSATRFEDDSGRRVMHRLEQREGRITFEFDGRSPRPGEYVASLRYRAALHTREADDGSLLFSWTLPPWRFGIDDATVVIDAPSGTRLLRSGEDESSIDVSSAPLGSREHLEVRRVHLPRTCEWRLDFATHRGSFAIPTSTPGEALRLVSGPVEPSPTDSFSSPAWPLPWQWALALALLVASRIAWVEFCAREARTTAKWLVPSPIGLRFSGVAAIAFTLTRSTTLLESTATLGLLALASISIRAEVQRPARLGKFRLATRDEQRRALWIGALFAVCPLEPSSWPGRLTMLVTPFAILLGSDAVLPLEARILIATVVGMCLMTGSRAQFPLGPSAALGQLRRWAGRLKADDTSPALALVVHRDVQGALADARVRLTFDSTRDGLLRLDVVTTQRARAGGWEQALALLVVVREASDADRAIRSLPLHEAARGQGRIAYCASIEGSLASVLEPLVRALRPASAPTAAPLDLAAA